MWVILTFLDPDSGSGSTDPIESGSATLLLRIFIALTFSCLFQDEDRQHDPLQRQEAPLEEDKAKAVNVQHELFEARVLLPLLYFIPHLVWNIIGDDSDLFFILYPVPVPYLNFINLVLDRNFICCNLIFAGNDAILTEEKIFYQSTNRSEI